MRKFFTMLAAVLFAASVFAQSPAKMSYQAVIRNSSNALVTNTQVGMQVSILQGSASGTAVYTETQTPTTNVNGLVSIEIGGGTGFDAINWANGPYFLKTETDPTGGTNYTITGTSQLLSVPYALHAKTAESLTGTITETDPVFGISAAQGITNTNINNWNSAFAWGDHATAGYLTGFTETDPVWSAASAGYYTKTNLQTSGQSQLHFNNIINTPTTIAGYGITDALSTGAPAASITNANITNWNTAYAWGNHATAGYLTSFTETDPVWSAAATGYYTKTNLQTSGQSQLHFNNIINTPTTIAGYGITDALSTGAPAASITNANITNWNTAFGWGDHAAAGYLTAEVDGSVTNEIELPVQTGNAGKYLTTNGSTPSWATPATGTSARTVTSSANYTIQAGDNVLISNAASVITYTLPSAAVAGSGAVLYFYGLTNAFNITTSQNIYDINGNAQTALNGLYIVILVSDGINKWCQIH